MDFELSDDLKMIRSLAHDFVANELKPRERDLLGRSADMSDAQATLSSEIEAKLVENARNCGLWGVSVPEEFGGMGLGTLANCLIEEELSQTVVPFHFGDVSPILFDGNESQRANYLTPVMNREKMAYVAFMEPDQRDNLKIKTSARKDGNHYVLNGLKSVVGRLKTQYFAVVFAHIEMEDTPTCFIVDAGTPGFDIQVLDHQKSSSKSSLLLSFKDCRIREENRLGEEGRAFFLGRKWLSSRRIVRGARVVGAAQRLLEEATTRAQTTQWFGRSVSERPGVRSALVDIAIDIHAGRLLVYEAAAKADEGKATVNEALIVKLFTGRMLRDVDNRVAHIYGGPGNTLMNILYRGNTGDDWGETTDLQEQIIAQQILNGLKI